MIKKYKVFKLILLVIVCNLLGSIGALATSSNLVGWYDQLIKPSFNPPNWIFGPVWTLLFTLMAIALYLILESKQNKKFFKTAIILFIIQFFFNITWSFVFFDLHSLGWAFVNILILLLFIILTVIYFSKINKKAGYLLIPYLYWVSFATILNLAIWLLNG